MKMISASASIETIQVEAGKQNQVSDNFVIKKVKGYYRIGTRYSIYHQNEVQGYNDWMNTRLYAIPCYQCYQ